MGSAASTITSLERLTAEDIGNYVAGLGEAYVDYKKIVVDNGVSGELLLTMKTEDDIKTNLTELGIVKNFHQKALITHLLKLINNSKSIEANVNSTSQAAINFKELTIDLGDKVTISPRALMSRLFEIQGIKLDPTDLDPAIQKIKNVVGCGFGDGINRFDVFINYRVAADADIAEKVYLYLKTQG